MTTEAQHASVPLRPPRRSSGTFERPLGATPLAGPQHFRDGGAGGAGGVHVSEQTNGGAVLRGELPGHLQLQNHNTGGLKRPQTFNKSHGQRPFSLFIQ